MAIIPMTLDAQVSVISFHDPAIDMEASARVSVPGQPEPVLEYGVKRITDPASWRDTVVFKAGQAPTVFSIGVIPPAELTRIEDECRVGVDGKERRKELFWRSFMAGLRGIENGPWKDVPKKSVDGVEYIDPAWIARTFVRGLRDVALDIGWVVYRWNQLQDDDVKN